MPRIYDAGDTGTFEVADDISDAEIQQALAGGNAPAAPAITRAAPRPAGAPLPVRAGAALGRYLGYLGESPTVGAIGDAQLAAFDLAKREIAADPRFQAAQIAGEGLNAIETARRAAPGLVYAGFQRYVPPVAQAAGRAYAAVEPAVKVAAHYLNPLNSALAYPLKLGARGVRALYGGAQELAGRAGEVAAEAVVPAVFAARNAASAVGGAVGAGLEREADYWRSLHPPLTPTPSSPVVPPPAVSAPPVPQWQYPPSDPAMRNVGEIYLTPAGPKRWVGNGWTDA